MFKRIETESVLSAVEKAIEDQGLSFRKVSRRADINYYVYHFEDLNTEINGDMVTPSLRIINNNDQKTAFRIMTGCLRWVCMNGLSAGDLFYSQRIIHREGQTFDDKLHDIPFRVAASLDYLQNHFKDDIESMSQTIELDQAIQIIGNLKVPDKVKRKALYHLFYPRRSEDAQHNLNLWGLWNNVNESLREKSGGTKAAIKTNDQLLSDIKILAA